MGFQRYVLNICQQRPVTHTMFWPTSATPYRSTRPFYVEKNVP